MNWVRRVGALMVLAALAGQAGAAVPGQQGAGPAGSTSVAHEPIYHVVRNNHDLRQDLMKFWYRGLAKPWPLYAPPLAELTPHYNYFPSGCLSSTRIVHGSEPTESILGLKLIRIVIRYPDMMHWQEERSQQFRAHPFGFFVLKLHYDKNSKNAYWHKFRVIFGNTRPSPNAIGYLALPFYFFRVTNQGYPHQSILYSRVLYSNTRYKLVFYGVYGEGYKLKKFLNLSESKLFNYIYTYAVLEAPAQMLTRSRCRSKR